MNKLSSYLLIFFCISCAQGVDDASIITAMTEKINKTVLNHTIPHHKELCDAYVASFGPEAQEPDMKTFLDEIVSTKDGNSLWLWQHLAERVGFDQSGEMYR